MTDTRIGSYAKWNCWSIIQLTAANRCIGRLLSRLSVDTLSSYSLNKLDREQLDEPKELESRLRSWRIRLNFKLNSVSVLSTASVPLNQHYWFSYTCQQVAISDCKKLAKFILPQLEHERSVPDVAAMVYISIYTVIWCNNCTAIVRKISFKRSADPPKRSSKIENRFCLTEPH